MGVVALVIAVPTASARAAPLAPTGLVSCGERIVVPDGRLTAAALGAGESAVFGATLRMGNSYSVEIENRGGITPPGTLTVLSGDDPCGGPSSLTTSDTSAVDPSGSGGIARASFVATGEGTLFRARLLNDTGGPLVFGLRWSDTTQFSPAWSTIGSYDTFFSFLNTTSAHLTGSLTLFDPAGVVLSILELSIPGGRTAAVNTASLGVDRNRTGSAKLIHYGPPDAILAEAAIANFGLSPAYVQPVKFQSVREAR